MNQLSFRQWLEVGPGGGGPGGGMEPPLQNPTAMPGAFADYHGPDQTDPKNPDGQLPPVKKMKKKCNK